MKKIWDRVFEWVVERMKRRPHFRRVYYVALYHPDTYLPPKLHLHAHQATGTPIEIIKVVEC